MVNFGLLYNIRSAVVSTRFVSIFVLDLYYMVHLSCVPIMSWVLGYNLKWKVVREAAIKYNLVSRRPEIVCVAVVKHIRRTVGPAVKTWIAYTQDDRIVLAFHESHGGRSAKGLRFTRAEIVEIGKALGMRRGPRWYACREDGASEEVESSDDEPMTWNTPATISLEENLRSKGFYRVFNGVTEDEDNESDGSDSEHGSDTETESIEDRMAKIEV